MMPPTAAAVIRVVPGTLVMLVILAMLVVPIDLLYVSTFLRDANTGWPDGRSYRRQRQPSGYSANGEGAQEHFSH
jgi:hypothetical protein